MRKMLEHKGQIETDIPEFRGAMFADFEKGIELNLLVAAFRRSPQIVHGFPFITSAGRRSVETDVGFHRDRESSAILGIGTRVLA